jgi:D-arabinose 1-dehydrogenase-like Zn-dependent alcohol dehydrogenase
MATGWRRGDAPGELAPIELAEATPGPGRVAIAVEAVALDDVSATPRGRVPGTAAVGTVTAVGPAADEWLGARVLVPALEGCGECERCRRGGVAVCAAGSHRGVTGPGALATAITAGARWLVRLDGGLALPGPAAAGLGAELAWAYALYARASLGPRDPVVILGAGARARAAAAIATAKGATAVVATDDAATAARLGVRQCPIHTAAIEEALAAAGADPRRASSSSPTPHLEAALRVANPRATVVVAAAPTADARAAAGDGAGRRGHDHRRRRLPPRSGAGAGGAGGPRRPGLATVDVVEPCGVGRRATTRRDRLAERARGAQRPRDPTRRSQRVAHRRDHHIATIRATSRDHIALQREHRDDHIAIATTPPADADRDEDLRAPALELADQIALGHRRAEAGLIAHHRHRRRLPGAQAVAIGVGRRDRAVVLVAILHRQRCRPCPGPRRRPSAPPPRPPRRRGRPS